MTSVIERKTRGRVRYLRLPEVLARTGLSRRTIYVRLEQGRFPRPVSLGSRAVGWIEAEVDDSHTVPPSHDDCTHCDDEMARTPSRPDGLVLRPRTLHGSTS